MEWLGERLAASAPAPGDREAYVSLFMEPAVERWLRPAPLQPFRDVELEAMLEEDLEHWRRHGFGPWTLRLRSDGRLVGRGGLRWTTVEERLAVELPWTISRRDQGRGLASEAAEMAVEWAGSLEIEEVFALVLHENRASRRVAEKVGFEVAGETEHSGLPHLVYRRRIDR